MCSSRPALARWAALGGLLLLGMLLAGLVAMHGVQASGPAGMSGVPIVDIKPMTPTAPMPAPHHPGGEVCLGMLVMAITLTLVSLGLVARTEIRGTPAGRRIRTLLLLVGRPPPSIYHLAVLRL